VEQGHTPLSPGCSRISPISYFIEAGSSVAFSSEKPPCPMPEKGLSQSENALKSLKNLSANQEHAPETPRRLLERSSPLPNEARPNAVRILEQFCRWKTKLLEVVPKATTPHKELSHVIDCFFTFYGDIPHAD
jgi:hypothetical protein